MIMPTQIRMPSSGTSGTRGARNGRLTSGSVRRMIQTPALTSTNAKSVPIDVRSPAMLPGMNAANRPT